MASIDVFEYLIGTSAQAIVRCFTRKKCAFFMERIIKVKIHEQTQFKYTCSSSSYIYISSIEKFLKGLPIERKNIIEINMRDIWMPKPLTLIELIYREYFPIPAKYTTIELITNDSCDVKTNTSIILKVKTSKRDALNLAIKIQQILNCDICEVIDGKKQAIDTLHMDT